MICVLQLSHGRSQMQANPLNSTPILIQQTKCLQIDDIIRLDLFSESQTDSSTQINQTDYRMQIDSQSGVLYARRRDVGPLNIHQRSKKNQRRGLKLDLTTKFDNTWWNTRVKKEVILTMTRLMRLLMPLYSIPAMK